MGYTESIKDQATRARRGATQQAAQVYTFALTQPSWFVRVVFTIAVLMILAAVFFLVLPVILVIALAFVLLAFLSHLWTTLRHALGMDRKGRRNVRVISRL